MQLIWLATGKRLIATKRLATGKTNKNLKFCAIGLAFWQESPYKVSRYGASAHKWEQELGEKARLAEGPVSVGEKLPLYKKPDEAQRLVHSL